MLREQRKKAIKALNSILYWQSTRIAFHLIVLDEEIIPKTRHFRLIGYQRTITGATDLVGGQYFGQFEEVFENFLLLTRSQLAHNKDHFNVPQETQFKGQEYSLDRIYSSSS